MSLRVLSVGYPLAAVSPDSAGGSEQILCTLDRALVARGDTSIVIAAEGSAVAGRLVTVPLARGLLDDDAKRAARARHRQAIEAVLSREPVDLVHLHGLDFWAYLPDPGVPVLATLHLPPDWYPPEALRPERPGTWLNCVSAPQHEACPPSPSLLPPIPNGVDLEKLRAAHAKRGFALFLGRICPEKGVHCAIAAAREAGVPLLVAGEVFPYAEHLRYFETEVRPHEGRGMRFLGPVGFDRKRRLLTAARCLLVPSMAAETSSLVAREAAACGTPVVAFPNGALSEAVEEGRTGFLVSDIAGMAAAIRDCDAISPAACRATAQARFSDRSMIERYFALYDRLAKGGA
jgi:glycosyltransferase involved in cell wall biosynthesis